MAEKPTYKELETRVQELEKIESRYNSLKESLQQRESLFKRLYDKAPLGYQSLDENGHFIVVNNTWLEVLGYAKEEVIGKSFADFLHPDWRDHFKKNFPRFKSIGEILGVEFEMVKKNKDLILVSFTGKISRDKKGNFQQTHCIFHDITERRRMEEALKTNYAQLQIAGETARFGGWSVDLENNICTWSDAVADIHGVPHNYAPSMQEAINFYAPEWREKITQIFRACAKEGIPYDEEMEIITQKGKRVWVRATGTAVKNTSGRIVKVQGSFQDITENRKLRATLSQAQKMESIGRLAGGVAHDFNNMLGVILGNTELALLQADENHDLYANLKEIQKASKRSADITKQLLAFARKQMISPKQIDLNDTVESMLSMLRRLIGEGLDLVWQPAAHLWPVKMDPIQIDQILTNLCVNARDATSGVGKLTIETGNQTLNEAYCNEHPGFIPGEFVLLAVSDNGCGMDKDTLENLFEPFFTTKEVGKGTGLGLATIYGIVKQNNGFINVYSKPGQGSTFEIFLPRRFSISTR